MIVPLGVSAVGPLPWLDYLYVISYIKLGVTPIKYVPQVCQLLHEGKAADRYLIDKIYCMTLYVHAHY